jgi:hypothetical protein
MTNVQPSATAVPTIRSAAPAAPEGVVAVSAVPAVQSRTPGVQWALPRPRPTEARHRFGEPVAELIRLARDLPRMSTRSARRGGAHREPPRTGRHRASHLDPDVGSLAHRRTIGGRPFRDVGRTAL